MGVARTVGVGGVGSNCRDLGRDRGYRGGERTN